MMTLQQQLLLISLDLSGPQDKASEPSEQLPQQQAPQQNKNKANIFIHKVYEVCNLKY